MANVIVSDTSPLITLEKMSDGYDFIRKLYETIIIPSAVLNEDAEAEFSDPLDHLEAYKIEDLIKIRSVKKISDIPEIERLDRGEKEAISLAHQKKLPLLIEETLGRKIARSVNMHISGIAGQIIKAHSENIIHKSEAKSKLGELLSAGRINRKIYTMLTDSL